MKLDLLDELLLLSQDKNYSLDCVIALEVKIFPSELKLKKAQMAFPKTAQHEIKISKEIDLENFANSPLLGPFHLEVAYFERTENKIMALKMSHLLGDALSMLLWLRVALGEENRSGPLELHTFTSKKDSPYRALLPSHVWPSIGHAPSPKRKVIRKELSHPSDFKSYKINDILSLALLKSLNLKRPSLWVPVNVRKNFWQGFGNGLSRMRLYLPPSELKLQDQLDLIRAQKKEAWNSGEIFLPPANFKMGGCGKKVLLKTWLSRPWADWGSLCFSHIHDSESKLTEAFQGLWGISNLSPHHRAAFFAYTQGEKTWITLTYEASIPEPLSLNLLQNVEKNFQDIIRELNC